MGGSIPGWLLGAGTASDRSITAYAGCQPSCLRTALVTLPDCQNAHFVDLGCGLGRSLFVAAPYGFMSLTGVEISKRLAQRAGANARAYVARRRKHAPVRILHGDASAFEFPAGDLVIFICHSFGEDVLLRVLDNVRRIKDRRNILIVYENPVYGRVLDQADWLVRWFAANVEASEEEKPFHVGSRGVGCETIVVWYSGDAYVSAHREKDSVIEIDEPGWRCHIQPRLIE